MIIKKTYYKNGALKSEIPYINNKKNGRARLFYKNGNIKVEIDYCDGKIDGYVKSYFEDGNIESIETFKKGQRNNDLILYQRNDLNYHDDEYYSLYKHP